MKSPIQEVVNPPMQELPNHYDAAAAATRFAKEHLDAGYSKADPKAAGKSFSMVVPPPNVTGSLHMGHALNNTLQDVLVRYRRMDGDNVCWVPGFDHASIAVHWLLERQLRAEGTSRQALGREAFLKRAWAFKEEMQANIIAQQKQLALSCDWDRMAFTLDEGPSAAVRETFVRLYEDGLIYRAERLVNWDPVTQTSVSDLEVVHEENVASELFMFAYPLAEGPGELVVATTRVETMLGDTAVAVHPDDPRYKHLIGQSLKHPFVARDVPIIADALLVDPEFGTGAVKVTPAHDFNDYEVGQRHGLPAINLLNKDGTLNDACGEFSGLSTVEAREQIAAKLEEMGLGRGREPHKMNLGRSERSGAILEPYLSPQWYVRTKPLATPAMAAVAHGHTQFVPAAWENTYFAWLKDIRDWCISRQLWWGHRIPAWTCERCQRLHVAKQKPEACLGCKAPHGELQQDNDVLDTWFSSALWPFSTQGWPNKTADLARWYPTTSLVTSFDIIFFWVARMMMLGQYLTGSVPFSRVYIHALIRDAAGEKMSKTKGNVIDPLQMIDKLGLDAFRFTLVAFAGQGRDVRWDESRAAGYQKFINKIWQAFRFVATKLEDGEQVPQRDALQLAPFDNWLMQRCDNATIKVREALDNYKFNEAADALYHFVWDELCDWSLEIAKVTLYDDNAPKNAKDACRRVLLDAFGTVARLMHPITPYLAEELFARLKVLDPKSPDHGADSAAHVMVAPFPQAKRNSQDIADAAQPNFVVAVVTALRRLRAEYNVPAKQQMQAYVKCTAQQMQWLQNNANILASLARCTVQADAGAPHSQAALQWADGAEISVPMADLIDVAAETQRLQKEQQKLLAEQQKLQAQLGRADFVARAPQEVVADKKAQLALAVQKAEHVAQALLRLSKP